MIRGSVSLVPKIILIGIATSLLATGIFVMDLLPDDYMTLKNLPVRFASVFQKLSKRQNITCFDLTETLWFRSENDMEFSFNYGEKFSRFRFETERPAPLPYISSNFFRKIANHIIDRNDFKGINGKNITNGDIFYVKTDFLGTFVQLRATIRTKFVLLTHDSDYSVPPEEFNYLLDDANLIAWFGQNINRMHPKLFPVPIGFAKSEGHNGNISVLREVSRSLLPFRSRKQLLYININTDTNRERVGTLQYFERVFNGSKNVEIVGKKKISWDSYMRRLGETKFVLSPPGNGVDCHRTWEALAMGAVPIVKNTSISSLYADMPVMVVNHWSQVTLDSLRTFEEKLNLAPFSVPERQKIWARYWLRKIDAMRGNDSSNSFC